MWPSSLCFSQTSGWSWERTSAGTGLLGGQKEGGTGWRKPRCQARADAGKAHQAHCLERPHCKQIPGSSEGRISLGVLSTREHKFQCPGHSLGLTLEGAAADLVIPPLHTQQFQGPNDQGPGMSSSLGSLAHGATVSLPSKNARPPTQSPLASASQHQVLVLTAMPLCYLPVYATCFY